MSGIMCMGKSRMMRAHARRIDRQARTGVNKVDEN